MEKMKRREFLAKSMVGVGGIVLGTKLAVAKKKPKMYDPYEMVPLGKTGIKVSRVASGTGMEGARHSSNQVRLGREKFEALLKAAYDRGVRYFDMADTYGSHSYLTPALKGIPRDKYVICSKIMTWQPSEEERERADVTVQRFLKEIDTEYIDLVLLHCMMSGDWPQRMRKYMDGLEELKQKGIVRAHGVSCHSISALEAAAAEPWVDSVHARINAYGAEMDDSPEKVVPVLKKLHGAGKGVVGIKLIAAGEFRYSDELRDRSIEYVLNLGCVDTMVVGFESVEEIDDFAARVRRVPIKKA